MIGKQSYVTDVEPSGPSENISDMVPEDHMFLLFTFYTGGKWSTERLRAHKSSHQGFPQGSKIILQNHGINTFFHSSSVINKPESILCISDMNL